MNEKTLEKVAEQCQVMIDRIKSFNGESWRSVEGAAIKRTSMELTRLLADLRAGREPRL